MMFIDQLNNMNTLVKVRSLVEVRLRHLIEIVDNADYKPNFTPREVLPKEVKARLLPAIKHPITGKLHTGKRGDTHEDLMQTHMSSSEYNKYEDHFDYRDNHTGFYDPHTKKFYVRARTEVDTTDLMTKSQRVRRFGAESLLIEADISTLYVCRPLLNQDEVRAWMRQVGFPVSIPDMHVTIVFSKTPMSWTAVTPQLDTIIVTGGKRTIEQFGDETPVTVLTFESNELQARWQQFIDAGASFDWPSYRPHITLTDEDSSSLLGVEPFLGDLWFGPEVYEKIDPDHR